MTAWYRVLCGFPIEMINHAVLELCLSETRFPEIGDLFQICQRLWQQKHPPAYSPHGTGHDVKRPTRAIVKQIADRFGLPVE